MQIRISVAAVVRGGLWTFFLMFQVKKLASCLMCPCLAKEMAQVVPELSRLAVSLALGETLSVLRVLSLVKGTARLSAVVT